MSSFLSIALLAAAAVLQPRPLQPRPAAPRLQAAALIDPLAAVQNLTATPATITFTAANPATAPSVPGNLPAVVNWTYSGVSGRTWSLTVSSGASTTFAGCSTVPVSAVTVTCSTAHVGGSGTGTCSPAFALPTTPGGQVASGTENTGKATYTVNLTFTLADSWKYIATTGQTCSLTLTYNLTLN